MQIAKVIGTVVGNQKEPSLRGSKFLLIKFVDENGEDISNGYEVAIDAVGAGVSEWVLVSRGSAARQIEGNEKRPSDAAIVAIIDTISVENRLIYSKRDHY
ncbi:EutN/CcmL family microcompartment protein [Planktothrix sp. FACHB-1365]|uniref:EutN/CcmL family microcompartment protein n=1 Tax=Planktothrix sp. FACHB-1365 TaxID=2692855 RepID=UPI0016821FAD|nr:EutN/CcmL family microcompartment protein [Planktothrix sp. FACHB-1365]MBD2481152.1 EutN/CcmL family microcompartment protein [Planktothrix sp. FACHB-1365]